MSDTQEAPNPIVDRYDRYLPIITYIVGRPHFELAAVKEACSSEKPGFVTRLVNELVEQGWLLRETNASSIRWNEGRGQFSPKKWLDEKLFGGQVKTAPEQERPRERLLQHGVEQLRNAELIAILIRSGRPGESAIQAGEKVANAFAANLDSLATAGRGELKSVSPAVEKTAYCQIMAGIELGRRVAALSLAKSPQKIGGVADAIAFCQHRFARLIADARQEEFHIVTLDTKNQVVDSHQVTVGTLNASLVHPREVFRPAIKDAAASVILVHNHPSGDPTPSREDLSVTSRLESAGELLGIDVLDHIVLGKGRAISIRQYRE